MEDVKCTCEHIADQRCVTNPTCPQHENPKLVKSVGISAVDVPKSGIKDSGLRRVMESGALRDGEKWRGRFDLISPFALLRLAVQYERGAVKYGDRNWEKGIPYSEHLCSALRHINQIVMGDTSEDHYAAASFHLFAIMHQQALISAGVQKQLDNLPHYLEGETCEKD